MRLTKEQAAENRQRIIDTAGRLFRTSGIDGVSVADLMKAAGFTHGGFYNHFPSKEALVAEVASSGLQRSNAVLTETLTGQRVSHNTPLQAFIAYYLSTAHRDNRADGCTIASLTGDVARQDEQIQACFAQGIDEQLNIFASYLTGAHLADQDDPTAARQQAIQIMCELVGAVVVARAIASAHPTLSNEILEGASNGLQNCIEQTTT